METGGVWVIIRIPPVCFNHQNAELTEEARQMAKEGLEKLPGVSTSQIKIKNNGLEL
jgi:hypothetical protein